MERMLSVLALSLATHSVHADDSHFAEQSTEVPAYLYKVISIKNWENSQDQACVVLSAEDDAFIHFATLEQLERITNKYWANIPSFVILKIETAKLPGELLLEANLGGENKYYHLYKGGIPLEAVVESIYGSGKQNEASGKKETP